MPHVSCGRTKPDSSLLKGTTLRSTQLYAEYPGVLVYKICTSISCSQKRSTATSRVFGYLGFSSTPPSVAMIRIGLSIRVFIQHVFPEVPLLKGFFEIHFMCKSIACIMFHTVNSIVSLLSFAGTVFTCRLA